MRLLFLQMEPHYTTLNLNEVALRLRTVRVDTYLRELALFDRIWLFGYNALLSEEAGTVPASCSRRKTQEPDIEYASDRADHLSHPQRFPT
jgi:hypothetical protein